jgi:ABC-type multidrug transport system fused ATPase/permease subunit
MFGLGAATAIGLSCVLYRDGALTLGAVYLLFRYTEMLRQPTEQIRNEIQDLQQADASMGRVESLLATEPALVDGPAESLPAGPLSVRFDRVSFAYADGTPVLRDVDVCLEPGRVLGVIGRTGAGKTTLTRLIPRLVDPRGGSVRLGGVDLREVRIDGVRARVGVVTQDVHLFNASLRDNLTLFDSCVTDDRLLGVLDTLGMGSWVAGLPRGLDTALNVEVGLSAGQAQVLACARIFLNDPDVVILDEASSRLDPATERLVHEALLRLLEGRTCVVVAHRLATIQIADDILVLEDGRVREHGPRLALAADPASRFSELLRLSTEEELS